MNPLPSRYAPPGTGLSDEEIHLHDYLNVLLRRRRVFWWTFLAVFVAVTLYTFLSRPVYEAAATLHVREEKVKGGGLLEDLGLSRDNPVETEIEILKSRTNAEEVVRRLHLDWLLEDASRTLELEVQHFHARAEDPEFRITLTSPQTYTIQHVDSGESWSGKSGELLRTPLFELTLLLRAGKAGDGVRLTQAPFDKTVQQLRDAVKASEIGKGTNIIRLAYVDEDPLRAQQVANTLAQVYLERSVSLKTEEASRSVEFISGQIESFRTILNTAEQDLQEFKSTAGIIELQGEAAKLLSLMTDGEKRWAQLQLRRQQALFAIETLQKAVAGGYPYTPSVLLDDPVVSSLAQKLAELDVERRGLLANLTEEHPRIRALQVSTHGVYQHLLGAYQGLLTGLEATSLSLKAELLAYENQLKQLPEVEHRLAHLSRQASVAAGIFTFLLQKHEEARIAKAATISNINVIDPAIRPERPIKPRKRVNLLLGLVVGGMLGVGLAFFREYLDDTINDVETAKRALGYPILAVIPHLRRSDEAAADTTAPDSILITHHAPRAPATEAFRSLRTALHFSRADQEKKVLLVTSAFPGEGKTTVAANLAVILAQTGARVCLVGCDLRKPTLHLLFGGQRSPGLTEVLIGDAELRSAIHPTSVPSLDFISAGTMPPNPAELLGSEAMHPVVAELRRSYDLVLLDAPPVLAVTDAVLLSAQSDLVMIVLEAGGVPLKAGQRVVELLHSANAQVAGTVFNDKTGKGAEYYSTYRDRYYGKYAGPYGYGYYSREYAEGEAPRRGGWLRRLLRK